MLLFQFTVFPDRLRGGIGDEFSLIAIKDTGIEGVQVEDRITKTYNRGNTQASG